MKKENLLKIITVNQRVEEEAATRTDILHFFGEGNIIFIREKSGNFEKGCLWQPWLALNPSVITWRAATWFDRPQMLHDFYFENVTDNATMRS